MGKRAVLRRAPHQSAGLPIEIDAHAAAHRLPVVFLLLMAVGNAWAQQEEMDTYSSGADKRLEFRDQLMDSCQKSAPQFYSVFASAGQKKPSKAIFNSYCACVDREAMSRFTDDDIDALSRGDKSRDDADIDFKLRQVTNACVLPLLMPQ